MIIILLLVPAVVFGDYDVGKPDVNLDTAWEYANKELQIAQKKMERGRAITDNVRIIENHRLFRSIEVRDGYVYVLFRNEVYGGGPSYVNFLPFREKKKFLGFEYDGAIKWSCLFSTTDGLKICPGFEEYGKVLP